MREKSDYEDFYVANEEDTREIAVMVKDFLETVKTFLIEKEVLEKNSDPQ